jgi:type II secretory pathway pseudopilin PulG
LNREGFHSKRQGFTLLDLISVLMVISFVAVLAIPRYIQLDASAKAKAIDAALSELNGREGMIWADIKFSTNGYDPVTGDSHVWAMMKNDPTHSFPDLGETYVWIDGPTASGGILSFKSNQGVSLIRKKSTIGAPARWSR